LSSLSPIHSPDKTFSEHSLGFAFAGEMRTARASLQNRYKLVLREGVDADFFSVRRLTLWPRPPATGTRRVSAPSRLAQRDVAKTWYPANLLRSSQGFHSKDATRGSWRRTEKLPTRSLGGRVPDYWNGPIWRKPNTDLLLRNYTRSGYFSQANLNRT
jgi:hypothetical protein